MAYPSGNGSERLMYVADVMNAAAADDMLVAAADTTVLVKSIVLCEMGNAAETLTLYQNDGANWIYVFYAYTMAAYDTLTWNERFCLVPADKLIINCGGTANIDVTYSFIDQDWT